MDIKYDVYVTTFFYRYGFWNKKECQWYRSNVHGGTSELTTTNGKGSILFDVQRNEKRWKIPELLIIWETFQLNQHYKN